MSYRVLNSDQIETTITKLLARIEQQFPKRGLGQLCAELLVIAQTDKRKLNQRRRPNLWVRTGVGLLLVAAAAGLALAIYEMRTLSLEVGLFSALQGVDSILNIVALAGASIWFLLNLESVMRREAILADLHELRSIAHVVDMHQLTKDPTSVQSPEELAADEEGLSDVQLGRYLDFCSELLSLTGKLAALYMQDVRDPIVIQTVDEIENLTGNLSRKIWQKIMILRQPPLEHS
jgi:hypothetical protein